MCESIVNQLLHAPMTELKRGTATASRRNLVEAVQRLFKLEVEGKAETAREPGEHDDAAPPADGRGRAE